MPADSDKKIFDFYRDNNDTLKVASYLGGLGLVPFLWFLGTLFGRLRRAEGATGRVSGIALTGGVVGVAIAMAANGVNAYGVLHSEFSVTGFRLSTIMLGYVGFALAVFVAATSIVVLRTNVLPSWLGWAGAIVALIWLVGAAGVSTERDAINIIGFVAFLVWAVWILVVSVLMFRAPRATSAPTSAASPAVT